jgi:CRISPR-associated protein Csx10
VWLLIRPHEPLLMGEVRADSQFLASRKYIPGRVLRGALALDLLREGRSGAELLQFMSQLRVGNFFPAPDWGSIEYALPLPATAMSCKRQPGFHGATPHEQGGHGVVDTLIPHLAYRLLQEAGAHFPIPFALECRYEGCRGRMEPFERLYSKHRYDGQDRYLAVEPRFHAQTKVALSRRRHAAFEAMLYTASALSPWLPSPDAKGDCALIFIGRVWGDTAAVTRLKEALDRTAIGALHSRGYGRVSVEEAEARLPPLEERLKGFNEALAQLWQDLRRLATNASALPAAPEGTCFTIDLLSPAVFLSEGVPSLVPQLVIGDTVLEPLLWVTRPDLASGWSTAWGLPKPTNLAARMGSVYVFRWPGGTDQLLPALAAIEEEGVGERRDESFGECVVCHPFHQEVEER